MYGNRRNIFPKSMTFHGVITGEAACVYPEPRTLSNGSREKKKQLATDLRWRLKLSCKIRENNEEEKMQ